MVIETGGLTPGLSVSDLALAIPQPPLYESFDSNAWDPAQYLKDYYSFVQSDEVHTIAYLTNLLRKENRQVDKAMLFGSGPTLHHAFAVVPYTRSLHVADYLRSNLEEILRWAVAVKDHHDWSPFVNFTLQCESDNTPSEEEIALREEETRSKLRYFIQADATQSSPLDSSLNYGLVLSMYCADSATADKTIWRSMMHNMASMVSPGGLYVTAALLECPGYWVGDKYFPSANVTKQDMVDALSLDFNEVTVNTKLIPAAEIAEHGYKGIILAHAIK